MPTQLYAFLNERMLSQPEEAFAIRESLEKEFTARKLLYRGKPFQAPLAPYVITESEAAELRISSVILERAADKTISAVFVNKQLKSYFRHMDKTVWEWIEKTNPFHPPNLSFTRLDAFLDRRGKVKYVEFNPGNPGGKGYADEVAEAFAANPVLSDLLAPYPLQYDSQVRKGFLNCFKHYGEKHSIPEADRRVAMMDLRESSTRADIEILEEYFNEQGLEALCIDPRDFEFDGKRLLHRDKAYPMVLRNMIEWLIMDRAPEMPAFMDAYLAGKTVVMNSMQSLIACEKMMLAVMTGPNFRDLYTGEELAAFRKYLPWTRRLSDRETTGPDDSPVDLWDYVRKNRGHLVLKPTGGLAGIDVTLGWLTSGEDWNKRIDSIEERETWVVQERVEIDPIPIPDIRDGKVVSSLKYVCVAPYVMDGAFYGCIVRTSDDPVVNVARGGGLGCLAVLRS
ncbi:MAG: hypothetical protein HYU64_02580 [Armatimonadetes bacterium]|nr:hypothetical protein [Armatimonadota bacterium]